MRILLVRSRELAYESASYFMDRIEEALNCRGHETLRFDYNLEEMIKEDSLDQVKELESVSCDAIIDFNSGLPRMEEDGRPWLDGLGIPFFNYVLDHPMYHRQVLKNQVEEEYVICIDRVHAEYVRENFPHIRGVFVIPIAGTPAMFRRDFAEKKDAVLIPVTYDGSADDLPKSFPQEILDDQHDRNAMRLQIAEDIASTGQEIVLMGHGWDETSLLMMKNVTILPPREYPKAIEVIARYKYVLDINPLFPCGMHDRVPNTLANGSVCVTTMSPEFDPGLVDGENIFYYKKGMEFDMKNAAEVAAMGEEYYRKYFTWEVLAEKLEGALNSRCAFGLC